MTSFRFAAPALALSLTLSAAGTLSVAAAASPAPAATAGSVSPASSGTPVGGQQLAARGVIVNLKRGVPPPPAMPGASYLLADMDTGQILVAKAPHAPHLPASTLKTLTALTLIPLLDVNHKIVVKPEDVKVDGTRLGIVPGTTYAAGTLLQGMLMASGNDTAYALARGNHSVAVTLADMNATAAQLGALDTVAKDPSGLDARGQQTSAYDLALIGRAAMALPTFRSYVKTRQATLSGGRTANGKRRAGFQISNHNKLIFNYPDAIGIKNGYTNAAKFTYIEAATRAGKTYLLTEMASPSGSWRPTAALLDWAFAHGSSVTPIGELVEPAEAEAAAKPTTPPTALPRVQVLPAISQEAAGPGFPNWIGVVGGISALALIAAWLARSAFRKRH